MALPARPLRWGFMSTAAITEKNVMAVRASPSSTLVAVASRDKAKADAWAARHGSDASPIRAYGSYEELLADADVDAVYIPLPAALHVKWVLAAAAARKHVLVEKPTGSSLEEVQAMVAACTAAGVQFMDGVMFNHHDRLPAMRKYLEDATIIGAVRNVTSAFGFMAGHDFCAKDIRMDPQLERFGALGDLGWYNIRMALWAFNYDLPTHVRCVSHEVPIEFHGLTTPRTPMECTGTLFFPGGRTSTFTCSFCVGFRQWAEIAGTKGRLTLDDFVISTDHDSAPFTVLTECGLVDHHCRTSEKRTVVDVRGCNQEANMFNDFAAAVASGRIDPFWPRVAMLTQTVLDACMRSLEAGGAETSVTPIGGEL